VSKKFFSLLLMMLIGGSVFAAPPESWINNSISYDWAINSELPLTSGEAETIGYDLSWFGFPGGSAVGVSTRVGLGFSLDAVPSFIRMHSFMGPAFTTVMGRGTLGYVAIGPTYTISRYEDPSAFADQQLGIGLDVGARFALAADERWDFGFVAGATGDITFLRFVNSTRIQGFSANIRGYFGFSFGSAMIFSGFGMYPPVIYI